MPNELKRGYPLAGQTIYAIIWRKLNNYVYDVGHTALEAASTWNDARLDECDVVLTDRGGGYYSLDFPSPIVVEDVFRVMYYLKAGASPSVTNDRYLGMDEIHWTGTAELIIGSTEDIITALKAATGFTAGGTMQLDKLMKLFAAFLVGKWQLKSGETSVYELLDPDDGTTKVMELTVSASSPYKQISVLI